MNAEKKMIIWGTGKIARGVARRFDVATSNPYKIVAFLDSNKQAEMFNGLPVLAPEEIENWKECYVIVAVNNGRSEILQFLQEKGLEYGKDYIHWAEFEGRSVLGIAAYCSEAYAAIVHNGRLITAKEERFTGVKSDRSFPINAIKHCLREADVDCRELDRVVYYENPILKADCVMKSLGLRKGTENEGLEAELRNLLTRELWIDREIHDFSCGKVSESKVYVCDRYVACGAEAFFTSQFREAAILSFVEMNGWINGAISVGRGNGVEVVKQMKYPCLIEDLQETFEENIIKAIAYAKEITGMDNLCVAVGTSFDGMIEKILKGNEIFDNVRIQSREEYVCGAAGAALYGYYSALKCVRVLEDGICI